MLSPKRRFSVTLESDREGIHPILTSTNIASLSPKDGTPFAAIVCLHCYMIQYSWFSTQ